MVQVIENKTDLEGTVASLAPHPRAPGFDVLVVVVARATPVAGVADLLSHRVGAAIEVMAPRDRVAGLAGHRIRFRARLAGPDTVRLDPAAPITRVDP
jgi:hypothetical protein